MVINPIPNSGENARGMRVPNVSTGFLKILNTWKLLNNHKNNPGAGGPDPFAKYMMPTRSRAGKIAAFLRPKRRAQVPTARGTNPNAITSVLE
jgi:hypothetical protein